MSDRSHIDRLRLGVIAPEFPPDLGGMATLAEGFTRELARTDDVIVFAQPADGADDTYPFRVSRKIDDAFAHDLAVLRDTKVDAWLALNAGLIPLAAQLEQPFFVYVHGSDFLNPWISYGSSWMEGLRKPYLAAFRMAVRRAALRRTVEHVAHLFTNSRRTSELAVETLGIQPSRISICPPGVDDKFFQASAPGDQHQIRLLTVTRLTKHSARKNVDGVLRAIALLDGSPSVTYTVVGNGDDQTRLQELARSLGIADRVSFRGRLGDSQLLECYRNADLFILAAIASKRDVEGFGIVYIEAAAGGIPSICSRVGGAVDAVHEGENGLLIPDSSPEAIAAGIRRYAASRTTFSSDRARAIADRYRWPKVAGMLRERLASELDRLSNPNRDDRESAA